MSNGKASVLLLSGSLNNPSHTRTNLEYIASVLKELGVNTYLWDLRIDPLPAPNPAYHRNPYANEAKAVQMLARLADLADGFVWGTPVYHNSYSGMLKNALDNLNIQQFRNKPVALVSNGSDRSGVQPCDQLRIVARGLRAIAIPTQVVTIKSDFELHHGRYILTNSSVCDRFVSMTDELVTYSLLMRQFR